MSKGIIVLGLTFCLFTSVIVFGANNTNYPPRLRCSESFFGVHFDFHAVFDCTKIRKDVDREMVELTPEPHSRRIDYTHREGKIHLIVPRRTIHEIIVIE